MVKNDKKDFYKVERFESQRLAQMHHEIGLYAQEIGGMPQNHRDVFEKRGWLLPFLFAYDDLLWGRWKYWLDILQKGTIVGSDTIPQMKWAEPGSPNVQATKKMFTDCLNHYEATMDNFADWLLWGMAGTNMLPSITDKLNEHYYRIFDLFLVLDNPTDYLSGVLCEQTGKGYQSGLGYFPTPFSITRMMVEMMHGGGEPEKMKMQTVYDPCVGCGAMLLPASNYFLRGYAQDISAIAVKLCSIQMHFYAPWYARPGKVKGFNEKQPVTLDVANKSEGQMAFVF